MQQELTRRTRGIFKHFQVISYFILRGYMTLHSIRSPATRRLQYLVRSLQDDPIIIIIQGEDLQDSSNDTSGLRPRPQVLAPWGK